MKIGTRIVSRQLIMAAAVGFVLGFLWLFGLRLVTYKNTNVHYHANFALYINGQQDKLDNFTFYEEVQSCGSDEVNNPKTRVHLHDNIPSVVHVHDNGATWGALFANLGYTLGNTLVKTDAGVYIDGQGGTLTFMLNGKPVGAIANRTIQSEDILLISYGREPENELVTRYEAITADAAEYNKRNDPSSCTGTKPLTTTERFKEALGLWRK